jgi:hypothetical protein
MPATRDLTIGFGLWLAVAAAAPCLAQDAPARVVLRFASDSNVVGHYRFTTDEGNRLVFDIPDDDPRASLLTSATVPREKKTELAATIVSVPREADEDRSYIVYWLYHQITGHEARGLSALQWDSIFQKAGRRATVGFSSQGELRNVKVGSEATRPVGQALARILGAFATMLPADSVAVGSSWQSEVMVPVGKPDGSQAAIAVRVTSRLREIRTEADGSKARIEFDGEAVSGAAGDVGASGRYYGESVFDIAGGRYDHLLALAELEVRWDGTGGLPPSRTLVEWRGEVNRR